MDSIPLVVDLDGTLVRTDTLHECLLALLRNSPLQLFRLVTRLSRGKAHFKQQVARLAHLDLTTLPINEEVVTWLREQKATGRHLILATGADVSLASQIAMRVGLFEEVLGSNGTLNLAGPNKATALIDRFGENGFDYAGNSRRDLPVWKRSRHAIVVTASNGIVKDARAVCEVVKVFPRPDRGWRIWLRLLRGHQWLKNLLLFTPIAAAHQLANPSKFFHVAIALIAFSMSASAVYLGNDLLDLENDRRHPRKQQRALASGRLPLWSGVLLSPVLLIFGVVIAAFAGTTFLQWLLVYIAITFAYSFGLKRIAIIDCLTLALLYTLRVIAGAAASRTPLSFWLLAFSIFFFLSLAFVKRYAELRTQLLEVNEKISGRGYSTTDASMVQLLGVASGFAAVLILALYLNTTTVHDLYKSPQVVWGAVPVLLYWVSWIWLKAHRGEMHDDPLVFAVREPESLVAGAIFVGILLVGAVGWPW